MFKQLERTRKQFLAALDAGTTVMITYRGPGSKGGVSSTLSDFAQNDDSRISSWLFVDKDALTARIGREEKQVQPLSHGIVDSHYAFCNEFLWPVMHEFVEKIAFKNEHYQMYRELNELIADSLAQISCDEVLVHDYQLAFVPALVKQQMPQRRVVAFWHIPWPKFIPFEHENLMAQFAKSLAKADRLGFHTEEYRDNFVKFASKHLSEYSGDNIVVAPLGLNVAGWRRASSCIFKPASQWFEGNGYVLSVDRADYTKGILQRLDAIEILLDEHPEWLGKVVFAQHCARTRAGLPHFDTYWTQCLAKTRVINDKFSAYTPVKWLSKPIAREKLAALYRDASVMLVTPLRDGLNLTAKEFISCQGNEPGVLVLSQTAGVCHELGNWTLTVDASDSRDIARQLNAALMMPDDEKLSRMSILQVIVNDNDLTTWSNKLRGQTRQQRR